MLVGLPLSKLAIFLSEKEKKIRHTNNKMCRNLIHCTQRFHGLPCIDSVLSLIFQWKHIEGQILYCVLYFYADAASEEEQRQKSKP